MSKPRKGRDGKAPGVTRFRLYMQAIEQTLAGRRKLILDRAADGTRRIIYLGRKGLWTPPAPPPAAPPETGFDTEPGGTE